MNEIRFIDLFSGIGGFRLGLERTNSGRSIENTRQSKRASSGIAEGRSSECSDRGSERLYSCVWSNDFNRYANQVYTKQFGEEGHSSADIRRVDPEEIPDFDLLCAGFPCQAFSVAGKRKGFQDTRGTLFFEICRIAKAKRPSLLLLENVKGLLSHDGGRTFTIILQTLDELGYWLEWQVLNSKYFGVPQNRERVFIIGHLRGGSTRPIFPITESNGVSTKEFTGGKGIASSLDANYFKGARRQRTFIVADRSRHLSGRGRNLESPKSITNALSSVPKDNLVLQKYVIDIPNIANTVDPDGYLRFGQRINGQVLPVGHRRIRRLTPVECERLQGFPDGWTEGISDTQRYRVLGNAVTVNIIEFLGELIKSSFTNMSAKEDSE